MNKRDEIKIEVLSSIDEEIIDKQTDKRYRLIRRNRMSRKKVVGFSGAAACLLVACSLFLVILLPILTKQVPVYKGMTVSNTMPKTQELRSEETVPSQIWLRAERNLTGSAAQRLVFSPRILLSQETVSEAEPETEAQDLMGENRALYYAKKNEDIYITIHLQTPEAYEILSFTLNGTKYQSYMFEEGSDSEQLILKVNVGEAQGLTQYTIDAIKYVDGTEIKDVRMEGDRTVTVAVYPEDQPTPEITKLKVGYETVSLDVTLQDSFSLIKDSKGRAVARLYSGDTVIDEQELSLEEKTSIALEGMTPGLSYTLRIMAEYDSMDGKGFGVHWLYEKEIATENYASFSEAIAEKGSISFRLDGEDKIAVETIELLNGKGEVERTVEPSSRTVEGLPIGEYSLKITYRYGNGYSKTGYVQSDSIKLNSMCLLTEIVKDAKISREYTGYLQVYDPVTQEYRSHWGIDVTTANEDKSVYAAFSGTVTEASAVRVKVTSFDESVTVIYDGLSAHNVKLGDVVSFGQKLGTLGRGRPEESYYGEHLHLELLVNQEPQDPAEYFKLK